MAFPTFVFTLSAVIGLQAQVNYVKMAKPFSSNPAFGVPKGPVSNTAIQVPIITWAADGTTVAANGGMTSTTSKLAVALGGAATSVVLQDDLEKQVTDYISGKSPFLRGTLGMINLAAEGLTEKDPGLEPVVFCQLSWSTGADGFVGRNARTVNELKGKTIVVQKNGPHIDLVRSLLQMAGLKSGDVTIKYVRDITDIGDGGGVNDPAGAMRRDRSVAGVACIYPDIMTLTRSGKGGDGTEGSVTGAKPILTTKTANRVIADVYAVRRDWFESNGGKVGQMREVLLAEQERFQEELKKPSAAFRSECKQYANLFLGDEKLVEDYLAWAGSDSQLAGRDGNFEFFERPGWSAGFARTNEKIQEYYLQEGFITKSSVLISDFSGEEGAGFENPIAEVDWDNVKEEEEILTWAFLFEQNKTEIKWQSYEKEFDAVFDTHQKFGGGAISVNGHVDSTTYNVVFNSKKSGKSNFRSRGTEKKRRSEFKKRAMELSKQRVDAVKAEYKKYLEQHRLMKVGPNFYNNIRFEGKGLEEPIHPIAKNKKEAAENRRVEIKVYELPAAELDL